MFIQYVHKFGTMLPNVLKRVITSVATYTPLQAMYSSLCTQGVATSVLLSTDIT